MHTMASVAVKLMTLAAIDCGSTEDPRFQGTPRQYGRIDLPEGAVKRRTKFSAVFA